MGRILRSQIGVVVPVLAVCLLVTLWIRLGSFGEHSSGSNASRAGSNAPCPVCPTVLPIQPVEQSDASKLMQSASLKCPAPPKSGEKPRIALMTATNEGSYQMRIADITMENKRQYATKHGYDLIVVGSILDKSRIYAWSKILALQRSLSQYHYIMWIDNDAIFTNYQSSVESQLATAPSRADADFWIAKDFNEINAGVLVIRCSDWSLEFLQRIWDRTDCVGQVWEEQLAIIKLMREQQDVRQHSVVLENKDAYLLQSHHLIWKPGHWVFHNAGCLWMMSEEKCIERLKDYLSRRV